MAVAGLPKLNDIKNAVTKAKEALSKYNTGKGSLKSLEDGISNLKSIQNDEYNKLKNLRAEHENKKYLNVDSYNSAKENYNKAVENYQKLYDYLKSGDVKNDNADYKSAKDKYDSVYAIINSNRWYEESGAYKAALEKAGQANQKHNTARDWFDNNDYLKQNSGYQDLFKNLKGSEETYNRAKDLANNENYLRDNSDYNNKRNTFNEAQNKLNDLDSWKNNGQYLKDHGGYQDALREIENKRNELREAESRMDRAEVRSGSSWDSLVNKKGEAERNLENAQTNANKKREEADRDANTKVQNQGQTRDSAEKELNRVRQESEQKANTARENAEKNYNTLREKEETTRNQLYDAAQNAVDTTKELRDSTKSEAEKAKDVARDVAQKAADDAKTAMDGAENRAVEAAYPKLVAAQKTIDANGTTLGSLADALSTAAYKDVEAQDKVVAQKDGLLQTAEKKYGDAVAAIDPDLETYNAYASDVVGYAKQFRENIYDIAGNADVGAAKLLFDDFNKLIQAGGFTDDITKKITPYFDGIEFQGNFTSTPETIGGTFLDVKGSKLNNFGQRQFLYTYTDVLSSRVQNDLTKQWLSEHPGYTQERMPDTIKLAIDYISTHPGVDNLAYAKGSSYGSAYGSVLNLSKPKATTYDIKDGSPLKAVSVSDGSQLGTYVFDMSSSSAKDYNNFAYKFNAAEGAAAKAAFNNPGLAKTDADFDLLKLKEAGLWDQVFGEANWMLGPKAAQNIAQQYGSYPEIDRFLGKELSGFYTKLSGYGDGESSMMGLRNAQLKAEEKIDNKVNSAHINYLNQIEKDKLQSDLDIYGGMTRDEYFDKMVEDAEAEHERIFGMDQYDPEGNLIQKGTPTGSGAYSAAYSGVAKEFALKGGDPKAFSNLDPATGLPLLSKDKLDALVLKYGNSIKGSGPARAAFAQEGWNMMSDSALLLQGPAILGLSTGQVRDNNNIYTTKPGIVNSKGQEAGNADYLTAAKQVGLDGDSYTMPIKFVPAGYAYGQVEKPTAANSAEYTNPITGETYLARINPKTKEFVQALDTKTLYADISDKTKDLYYVANAIENVGANKATTHAGILYKANENGILAPVLNENNEPIVNYYEGERVHHAGASGQLAELMPLIQMAAMVFAPQLGAYLNSSIGAIQVSAAVAPTAFTVGLPAVTLAQTIGATGVSMISGLVQNVVKAGLTDGNIGQAALVGAVGPAIAGNANQILNRVGIDQSKIDTIASAINVSPNQAANLLANTLTIGVTDVVLGNPDGLANAATSLAGQYVGIQVQNLVYDTIKGADPKIIAATVNAAGNVANIATQTTINGGDVGAALTNAAPAIITGAARAGEAVGKVDGPGTATIVERSRYPEPTPDKSDLITLRSPELSSDTPTEIKDMIYSAYADPSVKIDVAQAMPVTAENIQQLTRAAQEKVAQSMLQAAANDPLYARSVTTESSIQALRQAGMYTLADGLVGIASMVTPGNIGQNTNEDQIMAEKMKQFLSPIADGTYDYTKKLSPVEVTAQYNVPELFTKILPGESISKDGQLILQDGKGSGLYVDKSGTLYDQYGNPAVQNFVPPNVTPLVAPEYTSTVPTILPNTTTAPVKNPAVPPSFVPYVLPTTIPITTPATTPTTTPTTTPATTPTTTPTTMPETVPTTAPKTETVPKTETTPATQTVPKTETTAATQPAPVTKPITDLIPITPPVNAIPNTPVTTIPVTTPTTVTPNVPPVTPLVTPSVTPPVTTTTDNKSDITGVLAALAGAFGSGKVSTGKSGLAQIPQGYIATTTPLPKRPIGDLFPVSFTMMTPEEIAARSSTKIVRRGGLVSIRK